MMTTDDMTDKAFADLGAPDLVYVREVAASEIMDEVAGATDPDQPPIRLDPRQTLYAVHSADGMLYCLDEANGRVALIEATPNGWSERGRFKISPQTSNDRKRGKIWAHPVIAEGMLILRDLDLIYAFDINAQP